MPGSEFSGMTTYIRFAASSADGTPTGLRTDESLRSVLDKWIAANGVPFEVERLRSGDKTDRAFVNPALVAFIFERD
jgi:hypothetical protein